MGTTNMETPDITSKPIKNKISLLASFKLLYLISKPVFCNKLLKRNDIEKAIIIGKTIGAYERPISLLGNDLATGYAKNSIIKAIRNDLVEFKFLLCDKSNFFSNSNFIQTIIQQYQFSPHDLQEYMCTPSHCHTTPEPLLDYRQLHE